ncbi:MAG: helix-turn-helix transcriptional regulator [Balneolaceae bacterium]
MNTEKKKTLVQAFGRTIEEIRLSKNISQAELAERSDLHRTYISDLERGLKQPSLSTLVRLAKAFEIQTSDLIRLFEKKIEIN